MTGKNLEIISQIVLWYENSFRIDCIGPSSAVYIFHKGIISLVLCGYKVQINI